MSRRKNSRNSVSPSHSVPSDESDNSNLNDELPAVGLPKSKTKDAKGQKKVSFDFPVNVITKSGKFSGMGTINLIDEALEKTLNLRSTKADLKDVLSQFEQDLECLMEREQNDELIQVHPVQGHQRKTKAMAGRLAKTQDMKEALEAKRREMEAKRDTIKQAIEKEKQAKAELEEANRIYKPTECLKHITLELHPSLASEWYMGPTLDSAREVGVRVLTVDEIFDPGLVLWTRAAPCKLINDGGEVRVSPTRTQSPHSLVVMTLEQLKALVAQDCLLRHVTTTTHLVPGCRAFVLLTVYQNNLGMTREQIGKIICELQIELLLSRRVDVRCAESAIELHDIIMHYTKAVAEEPYKRAKRDVDEQAEFYMRGDNKNCVIVDKQGNGLSRLWEQMLGVLPQSSLEVARTLGAHFPTPAALAQMTTLEKYLVLFRCGFSLPTSDNKQFVCFKALQSPGGVGKMADIGISRTNVPGAKTRRLGPEFARKLHTLFTTEDGNTVIE